MEDSLIISYDSCPPDVPTLIVAKKIGQDFSVLNKIQGDAAFGIYCYLTGGAELKSTKEIPKKVVCDGDDESDYVYCPSCNEILGTNELVYDDFCDNYYEPIYCRKCGQCLTWE